jgi:[protein-PII] uridylyltransferase
MVSAPPGIQLLSDVSVLEREIAQLELAPRADAVAGFKALRQRELAAIAKAQNERPQALAGLEVVGAIATLSDAIIKALARRAFDKAGAPADWSTQVGVIALGGYGRGELNPYSDIDLMVLAAEAKVPAWLTAANAELQALLWDVKFTVGASLRSLGDLERIIEDDFVTGTAVIEQRSLLAGEGIETAMRELCERFRRRRSLPFLKFKIEELEKRRSQAGVSLFTMEPNLKTNPGGLRDVQLMRNVAFMIYGSREIAALSELEVFTPEDLRQVEANNDQLLALRSLLHFHHQRKQDVFQLADQVRVAKQLGYQDVSRLRAVEHFMKLHYARALHVHQMVELCISRLRAKGHLGRWTLLIKTRRTIDNDFVSVQGQVYVAHAGFWNLPDAGSRLLRMCRLAQLKSLRLSLELQRAINSHLAVITDEVRTDRAIGRVFLDIIGDVGKTRPILEDMHNAGLLGAYLPEFGNLTCHMQFGSYHQFTVDQHTLFAMGNLDAVANGTAAGLPGMRTLFPAVKRKDLLALGLLLHDMGKYMGRGHVPRGALMVAQVASRLGLDEAEEDLVYFLVDRHVMLSDASRMRDFNDPRFLASLGEAMGGQEQLDMLYCLTWADAKAVGEGVLTGWQEALLGELYQALSAHMRAGAPTPAPSRNELLLHELVAGGVAPAEAAAYLAELPRNYLHQCPPGDALRHFRVLAQARSAGVGVSYELKDKYIMLAAAVPDRHALFADVTATLSGHGFDIIDARTWVTASGMVVYSYRLTSIYPTRVREESAWVKFRNDLLAVSTGKLSAETLLAKRRNSIAVARPADSGFDDPAVKVEQRTSEHHTIVDIHTKDEVGLLSRLCRSISSYGCDISFACINTMGDVAVDVFYVARHGSKLSDEEADGLRQHLISGLNLQTA